MGNAPAGSSKNKETTHGWDIRNGTSNYVTNLKHSCLGIYDSLYKNPTEGCNVLAGHVYGLVGTPYGCGKKAYCDGNKKTIQQTCTPPDKDVNQANFKLNDTIKN